MTKSSWSASGVSLLLQNILSKLWQPRQTRACQSHTLMADPLYLMQRYT